MLLMFVSAMTAAGGSYMARAVASGTSAKAFLVIFTLIMPILLVVGLNLARLFLAFIDRFKRRDSP